MTLVGVATRAGVTSSTLQELIQGKVGVGIASRLGTTSSSLQQFIDGGTSIGLAATIGCTSGNLQVLRNAVGREGAIGFLIGLCLRSEAAE